MKIVCTGTAMTKNTPEECLNCTERFNCDECKVAGRVAETTNK